MPDLTSNYAFKKPKSNEYARPDDFNDNWDSLDEKLKNIEENAASESAPLKHTHNATDINAGTLDSARLPVVPVNKGGTGATTAEQARANLGAEGKHTSSTVTLTSSGWSGNSQTVSISGMTATLDIVVSPAPASQEAWGKAGIYCSAQGAGTLTFTCKSVPTTNLAANILTLRG